MKKNSKKNKPVSESSNSNNNEIYHLGFVVDSSKSGPKSLTHALVNLKQEQNTWFVVELAPERYPSDTKDSVGRYFRTVFNVIIKAWLCYKRQGKLEKRDVIIKKEESSYIKIGSDLRNWARTDKVKGGSTDFPKLRMAIHNSLFAASGTRKPFQVIWKGSTTPNATFFWTKQDFANAGLQSEGKFPFRTVTSNNIFPKTSLTIETLFDISKSLIYADYGYTWQDLYKKALINSIQAQTFIELTAKTKSQESDVPEQVLSNQETHSSSLTPDVTSVKRLFEKNRRILLTGSSGSGKTTTLRHLAWEFALGKINIAKKEVLPVYVPLKWFGKWPKSNDPPNLPPYIAFWIKEIILNHLTTSDISKCSLFFKHNYKKKDKLSKEEMLQLLEIEVCNFFSNETGDFSNIVFLFDGLNEILEEFLLFTKKEIVILCSQKNNIIVSTRLCGTEKLFPQLTTYEVEQLSDNQIIDYLNVILDGNGNSFFNHKIAKNGRLLSMARVPFYLYLIIKYHQTNPEKNIPTCEGELLEFFVQNQYADIEKHQLKIQNFPKVEETRINYFLRKIAYKMIEKCTDEPETVLSFPDELLSLLPEFSITELEETAKTAEQLGFLEKSGAFREILTGTGIISFRHDNFRDYFAAKDLLLNERLSKLQNLFDIIEFYKWEHVLLIYFGLIKNPQHLHDDIQTITEWDPLFATNCLLSSPAASLEHANKLRKLFEFSRIHPLYAGHHIAYNSFDLLKALSRILSFTKLEELIQLYDDLSAPELLRDAVPEAIVLKCGESAIEYFKPFLEKFVYPDNSSACLAIHKMGTVESWEIISNQYIKYAKDMSDYRYMPFEMIVTHSPVHLPATLILKQVKKARKYLKDCGQPRKFIDRVVRFLACPITDYGHRYIDDLLELRKNKDKIISKRASEALLKNGYPDEVDVALKKLETQLNIFNHNLYSDIKVLADLNDSYIDQELWKMFEQALTSDFPNTDWSKVPDCIASRADQQLINRLVNLCLKLDHHLSLQSLHALTISVPNETLKILIEKSLKVHKDESLWQRITVLRALCGDKSIGNELIGMLTKIDDIRWRHECNDDMLGFTIDLEFQRLLINAVDDLRLKEAMQALMSISRRDKEDSIRTFALIVLDYFLVSQIRTEEQIKALIETLVQDIVESDYRKPSYNLSRSIKEWPLETLKLFFQQFRDAVEFAMNGESTEKQNKLYEFLMFVRGNKDRRFIDIFKGWPINPPEHS
ncbi:NACHT domain-containing protein [Planctomycetota bacterium]